MSLIGLGLGREQSSGESGDIEGNLPNLFVAFGEASEERAVACTVLITDNRKQMP